MFISLDDFTLEEKVGEGTFGEVYKGLHKSSGEKVALKRLLVHKRETGFPLTSIREISVLQSLMHLNIINIHSFCTGPGESGDDIYMVFPYMEHDLTGILENQTIKLSNSIIKCYMKQLFEDIFFILMLAGFIHRDIKASNLLIDNNGNLKIADFGLARKYNSITLTPGVVTRWYRAPEVLLGLKEYTPAIDIWSGGCVFAEMFKREPIFQGSSDIDQLELIIKYLGNIDERNMPGYKNCIVSPRRLNNQGGSEQLRLYLNTFIQDNTAIELIEKILCLNPHTRLKASSVLTDNYFWSFPLPIKKEEIPSFPSSHEIDKRKPRKRELETKYNHINLGKNNSILSRHPPPPEGKLGNRHPPPPSMNHLSRTKASKRPRIDSYIPSKKVKESIGLPPSSKPMTDEIEDGEIFE
ncbi:kinase-like protein [Rozella allomycis CSF55]|uniref:Kinase-like protein n=1 Tax=Rozella allomycis (strain CSF55) TaxID=988480 RepID=A0A075AQL6_ROZAC|nr:Protein kinase, catalytic domain-containing protein [Rozella allomycis CSF55]RKP21839.1 kinase-like protein [Rozella allomycis CSF55]|eukprot:EPZ32541.1 Protein kinase, catalytic domain-containing protein [Rozella allomycis CSF55]